MRARMLLRRGAHGCRDVGYNSNVDMEFLGTPDLIIGGFAPELYGRPLDDGELVDTQVYKKDGNLYYQWALKPHRLVVATATGNRVRPLCSCVYAMAGDSLQANITVSCPGPTRIQPVG